MNLNDVMELNGWNLLLHLLLLTEIVGPWIKQMNLRALFELLHQIAILVICKHRKQFGIVIEFVDDLNLDNVVIQDKVVCRININ